MMQAGVYEGGPSERQDRDGGRDDGPGRAGTQNRGRGYGRPGRLEEVPEIAPEAVVEARPIAGEQWNADLGRQVVEAGSCLSSGYGSEVELSTPVARVSMLMPYANSIALLSDACHRGE